MLVLLIFFLKDKGDFFFKHKDYMEFMKNSYMRIPEAEAFPM